jgi:hypothetical protein
MKYAAERLVGSAIVEKLCGEASWLAPFVAAGPVALAFPILPKTAAITK